MEDSSVLDASKKMQYARLRSELDKLTKNVQNLETNIKVTVNQIPAFRKMGTLHSSMFMSGKSVLNEADASPSYSNTTR